MNRELLKMQATPKDNVLELYFHSEIAPDGWDWWSGEAIQSETSANTIREMLAANPGCTEIHMYINSCGGSVAEGYAIFAQLKRFSGTITCWVDGFANSIASIIAMAADKIIMYQNSVMTIHNMMGVCYGNAADHRKCAEELDQMMVGNRQLYLARSGGRLDEERLIELLDAETVLTAQECLSYGLCDEVLGENTDMQKAAEMMQRESVRFAQAASAARAMQCAYRSAMQEMKTPVPKNEPPAPISEASAMACFTTAFNFKT